MSERPPMLRGILVAPPIVLSVVVVDDSDAYRSGLARAVRAHAELELTAELDNGYDALTEIPALAPDVILLDVRMPGLDGLEVVRRLRQEHPSLAARVVLLSAYMDDGVVARGREAGADACLSKGATRRDICAEAIRVVRRVD